MRVLVTKLTKYIGSTAFLGEKKSVLVHVNNI